MTLKECNQLNFDILKVTTIYNIYMQHGYFVICGDGKILKFEIEKEIE